MNNQEKLLSAIIEITSQRDQDMLDCRLITMLMHLVPITRASLYRILNENMQHVLEQAVHFAMQKEKIIELKNLPHVIEAKGDIKKCIVRKEILWRDNDKQNSQFFVPIFYNQQITGVISLESKDKLSIHYNLLRDITKIYENYLFALYESERDQLTGLRNRRTFDKQLSKLLEIHDIAGIKKIKSSDKERRHLRKKFMTWLVTMDIDHFKQINDSFGHVYGDEVLLLLSQLMKKTFRDTDLLFRFGGEEFVVILTATTENSAYTVLERFRRRVEKYNFPNIKQVTLSIGYAQIRNKDFPLTILDKADKALYFAKRNGRNQVCCYEKLICQGKIMDKPIMHEAELF